MKVYSPIAIDLGGKNTGVYMAHRNEGCDDVDTRGAVVVASADKVTWSQQDRTAKRHQRRGLTRKRLVRRLLWQILGVYGVKYEEVLPKTSEFINGLLKRRGFSYLTDDNSISAEDVSGINVAAFSTSVENNFDLEKFSSAADIVKKLEEGEISFIEEVNRAFSKSKNEIEKDILQRLLELEEVEDEKTAKDVVKEYSQAYIDIRNLTDNLIKNLKGGHKPRSEYFENIRKDILANESILGCVLEKLSINAIEFSFLVGNLSNLQLRTLRRYFNDIANKRDDKYNKEKLYNVFEQWVLSWHCKTDKDKAQRRDLCGILNKYKEHKDIFSILVKTNPLLTTPPYEDQNNRNPVKDLTLLLDDKKLDGFVWYQSEDKKISCWREIADSFIRKDKLQLQDGLDEICRLNDRKPSAEYLKSLTKKENNVCDGLPSFEDKKRMYFLQRLLDCSKALDPYCFRNVASLEWDEFKASELYENIKGVFGNSEHLMEPLYLFVRQFYKEERAATDGVWTAKTTMMFRTSDVNPPRKNKIMHIIVGHILGTKFESLEKVNEFVSVLDSATIQYQKEFVNKKKKIIFKQFNKQFWKALEHIEETRKSYGNIFNDVYADAINNNYDGYKEEEKVVLENCIIFVEKAVRVLAEILNHSEREFSRYNNPFSLAQLYTIIKKDTHGFSSTCEAIAKENQWRSAMIEFTDEEVKIQTSARCKRLSADCVRPFDGMLSRIIERQVQKIADLKFDQIKDKLNSGDSTIELTIPIVLEENAFTFTEGLIEVKTGKNPTDKERKKLERLKSRTEKWADKNTRIKEASCGICPYTGEALGESGEYDHIIPRASTKKKYGTVFNHEANFIYCSNAGNTIKNDLQYNLENLNETYLQRVFNLSSTGYNLRSQIKEQIKKTIERLSKGSVFYQSLTREDQRDIRHALFIPSDYSGEIYKSALKILQTNQMARVNGTQAFFAKRLIEALDERIKNYKCSVPVKLNVFVKKAKAEDVSHLRSSLESKNDKWKKLDPQPAFSHIADAMLSLYQVEPSNFDMGVFCLPNNLQGRDFDSEIEQFVSSKLPTSWSIELLKRTNFSERKVNSEGLFKDTIYKEHFVPVWGCKGKLYVGFKREQILMIKENKASQIFELVRPFLIGCPNCSLDELTEELKCYPFNKQKTIEWMFEKSKLHDDKVVEQYKCLLGFHYVTLKESISEILKDYRTPEEINEIVNKEQNEILEKLSAPNKKETDEKILEKTSLKSYIEEIVKCFNFKGYNKDVLGKFRNEHIREISAKYYNKEGVLDKFSRNIPSSDNILTTNNKIIPSFRYEIDALCIKFREFAKGFQNTKHEEIVQKFNDELIKYEASGKCHKRVRKQYSLPVIPTLGGELIWVRRRTWDGKYVYQLLSPKNTFNLGFAKYENKLDFDDIQRFDFVDSSKNLATLNLCVLPSTNEVESFFSWRNIYAFKDSMDKKHKDMLTQFENDGVKSLEISPRQKSRMYIRVEMSLELLKKISNIKSLEMLPTTIDWKKCDLEFAKRFTARKTLFIKKVFQNSVVVEYETSSATASMKELYNAAR